MSQNVYRWFAGPVVLGVAVVAGWVSFAHIQTLALAHGYTPDTARLLPLSVDGLIVAASLALMAGARPWLSRSALVLGVAATIFANIAQGAGYGPVGAIISAWPAVAFIVASEVFIGMVRTREPSTVSVAPEHVLDVRTTVPDGFSELNGHRAAAEELFAGDLEENTVPSIRRIRSEMRVGQPKATLIRDYLATLTSTNS